MLLRVLLFDLPQIKRFSYGTVIGATFAAMYPELVNRMVLDGVVDAELYYNDVFQSGRDSMTDTHKVSFLLCEDIDKTCFNT